MNEIVTWVKQYGELSVVLKIAVPVALLLVVALYAFLLWTAARVAKREDLGFPVAFGISAIDLAVMAVVSYFVLNAVGGDDLRSLGDVKTQVIYHAVYHVINLGLLVGLLAGLTSIGPIRGVMVWGVRFVLQVIVGLFVAGTIHVGGAMYLGVQAPGGYGSQVFADTMTTGVLLLAAAFSGLIFWMAGVLANAERLKFLVALLLATAKNGLLVGAFYLAGKPLAPEFPNLHPAAYYAIVGGVLLLANLALVLVGSWLVAGTSIGRGILIWLLEIPLWALFIGLVLGIDMVSLSVVQTYGMKGGMQVLEYIVTGLLGAVVAAVVIFFGGQLVSAVGAPRRAPA